MGSSAESMTSAPSRACSSTPGWTRLEAQITTSAAAMAAAPRKVIRSGAPGPAPMKVTLPVLMSLRGLGLVGGGWQG